MSQYQVHHGYLMIPIEGDRKLQDNLEIEGNKLNRKSNLHVSLIALKNYSQDEQNFLIKEFEEFAKKFPFKLESWEDEYYFVSQGNKYSLIQMCQVRNLPDFYDHINHEQQDFVLAKHPAHVTLYVTPNTYGIGINNRNDLEKYAEKIIDPFEYYSLVKDRNPRRK